MSSKNRSVSDSSFFKKLKLSNIIHSKSSNSHSNNKNKQKKRDLKQNSLPNRRKSRKYESVDALIRPSISLRRSGKGHHEIAKRRISAEFIGNDGEFSFAPSKRTSQFELPDIVSVKSNRTKRTHSLCESDREDNTDSINDPNNTNNNNEKDINSTNNSSTEKDLDFSFAPRRSLHGATGNGMKRINTAHGFFNIPVTIENHNERNPDIYLRNKKTNNSLPDFYTNKSKSENKLEQHTTSSQTNNNENTSSSGILGTLLSLAHSAVNHVPRISIEEPNNNNNANNSRILTERSGSPEMLALMNNNASNRNSNDPINPRNSKLLALSNSKEDTPFNDTGINDTVIHNPANKNAPNINRSTSFLKHLDYLLSASNQNNNGNNGSSPNSAEDYGNHAQLSPTNDKTNILSHNLLNPPTNNKFSLTTPASTESRFSVNTNDGSTNNAQLNDETVNKVKFEPLKSVPPAITSLGKGNLTLDAFDSNGNVEDKTLSNANLLNMGNGNQYLLGGNNETLERTNNNGPSTDNKFNTPVLMSPSNSHINTELHNNQPVTFEGLDQSNVRNSSYVNLTKQESLEEMLKKSRARSKTLPAHEANAQQDGDKTNNEKRNSRYSSVSNDEAMNGTTNPRKSRTLSRNFLNRRSFSPNINMKVPIPGISLRNSINKYRNSNELLDQPRPRTSTNLSGSLTPLMGINYENYRELEGIEYANEKRNTDFHNLFNDVGLNPNEKLIIDHSCALSRDILLQGRMYISDQHLCFYSNILGWVSTVIIPFNEIVQIEKKTTAGIFPNGIVIDTLHTKYVFASFISRDATFDLITDVWNQIILGKRHVRDNDDDFDSELLSTYSSNDNLSQGSEFYDDENDSDLHDTDMTSSDDIDDDIFADISGPKVTKQILASKLGPIKHAPTTANYSPAENERLVSETVVKGPLGKVATILFGDDVAPYEQILKAQKNFDLSNIPSLIESKNRDYSYVKPLNAGFGPSKTKCLINDKIIHYDLNDYVHVVQSSKTPDVPSGNAFIVKNNTILTWDKNNCTKVTVYFSTEWTSKSWLKGAIEKGAYDGVVETTRVMNQEVDKMLKSDMFDNMADGKLSEKDKTEDIMEVSTLPTAGPTTHAPTSPAFKKEKTDVVVEQSMNIAAPLGTVFELLYGNDTSYFLSILEKQNNFNISAIPKFTNSEREFTYIKKLNNSIGPKQTKCVVNEKIDHKDFNAYTQTTQIVRSPDVPYGNSFSVHTRIFLSWGPSNTTNMMVVTNVVWTGKSLLKGTIEKGCIEGQRNGSHTVVAELKEIIANAGSTKKKTRKRTKTMKQPTETKLEVPAGVNSPVDLTENASPSLISSLINNFDLTSISGIIITLFTTVFLISLITRWFHRGSGPAVVLIRPGRILIDGNEYNYVPNIKTLYEVYEDDIINSKNNNYKGSDFAGNVVTNSESSIWDWLENRGEAVDRYYQQSDTTNGKYTDMADQTKDKHIPDAKQLQESIKITEQQLNQMKYMLENAEKLI
ncbi:similar to Saccharomyces cerevisiae YHR080C Protein of unknown function that may interact with ribosomes, based on co-purification experiments [Maudiozyma saulgeensis]|uniref:VASt domain-containing protein n=1 Tax=Maudiozyma saulgeensis TaxID=1789683 RepID=A0A1X7R1Z1_9SACH|nr:similar to Saccharomyces cerevisiae YHR080C Protein of unknown function that may interact with ribosomes, based on co-purification experiments [Kazachstania saulgeensis]